MTRRAALSGVMTAMVVAGCGDRDASTSSTSREVDYRSVGPTDFALLAERSSTFVLNVHTPDEGSIPGTDAAIPYDQLERRAGELPDRSTVAAATWPAIVAPWVAFSAPRLALPMGVRAMETRTAFVIDQAPSPVFKLSKSRPSLTNWRSNGAGAQKSGSLSANRSRSANTVGNPVRSAHFIGPPLNRGKP